jgi:ribose transport system substrate-binding protein
LVHPKKPTSLLFCVAVLLFAGCGLAHRPVIALIPRTTGFALWEAEHAGAMTAAAKWKCGIYWNAPAREDDIENQIGLVQRVTAKHYDGLVLAPDHSLAMLTPVRRALAAGIPVVIVSSALELPSNSLLSYILSDDKMAGRMAAERIGAILGHGSVAVLGVDPDVTGIVLRQRALEETLEQEFPAIRITSRGPGAFNAAEAQQATLGVLASKPAINAVIALTAVSTRAVHFTLKSRNQLAEIKLVGFEQDAEMIQYVTQGEIDSIIAEDTFRMGYDAVEEIDNELQGKPVPKRSMLAPVLVTRENAGSPQVQQLTTMDWFDRR